MALSTVPTETSDAVNARILAVSEDRMRGFQRDPLSLIARESGVERTLVVERIRAMLETGTIRRVRQTLMSTNLAHGALVAWRVSKARLHETFDRMFREDPFSGHVVIRSTDRETAGSAYRLWTTLKVPRGFSLDRHCQLLLRWTGAEQFCTMPAKCIFALGVGHVRRRGMQVGSRSESLADAKFPELAELDELEWRVLMALKEAFSPEEIGNEIWQGRAEAAGFSVERFHRVAEALDRKGVLGRFSTFLEHVKPLDSGERVTSYNGLFHWAVPPGREVEAGREVGRHHILTHCYWREAGAEFGNVNLMAVAHGMDKDLLHRHKAAIDQHLEDAGIPVAYTNVFWGGRSEIKPSEICPTAYRTWCERMDVDPEEMRETEGGD